MRKRIVALVISILSLSAAAWPQDPSAGQGRKIRVAVLDFDYATVRTNSAAIFGTDVDVGKGIADMLVTDLVKSGTYSVIERKALDKVIAEQNFSNSDRANPASAAKLAKLLGVDAIIVGSVTQFGSETDSKSVNGLGSTLGGFGIGGVGRKESSAIVGLDARIINVDTAQILIVATGKGESKRKSASLLGGGGTWRGFGTGGVDFSKKDFQQTIIGEAIRTAVDKVEVDLMAGTTKIEARKIVVEGLVASVEAGEVILNVGGKAGLKVGDRLTIERVTREVKDPVTNQVIRKISTQVGVIEITNVDDISSVAKIVSGNDFKIGDAAKTMTN
jgi:curli biogenesis system outer membrane secretion channel CsgG